MLRVDTIPWFLQPFFWLYGYGSGIIIYGYARLLHFTCKIEFTGATLPKDVPVVYCLWHKNLLLYFTVFSKVKKQVWMNHPAWYMLPVHVMLRLTGVEKICLGSSGNSGKAALENVINYLKKGYSTTIASDGPAGPPQELKPGVLFMSCDAQVPVIPLHFLCSNAWRMWGWDNKYFPALFSVITVKVGAPILMDQTNLEESATTLTQFLNS